MHPEKQISQFSCSILLLLPAKTSSASWPHLCKQQTGGLACHRGHRLNACLLIPPRSRFLAGTQGPAGGPGWPPASRVSGAQNFRLGHGRIKGSPLSTWGLDLKGSGCPEVTRKMWATRVQMEINADCGPTQARTSPQCSRSPLLAFSI